LTKRWRESIGVLLALLVILSVSIARSSTGNVNENHCAADGIQLYGDVKVVEHFADLKVKVVESFPDLKVKVVESFPDSCGKWRIVESFPDFTVKFVNSFPDIEIEFVNSFPGIP